MNKGVVAGLILVGGLGGAAVADKPENPIKHEQAGQLQSNLTEWIDYGLLVEVEGYTADLGGASHSDILLATVEFDLGASMDEWIRGHVGLLWEQYSREDDNVDEAYIELGGGDVTPFCLVVGRFYEPVGDFETVFVSDPLTLELAEINRVAAMGGYVNSWLSLNVGAFRGDVKEGVAIDGGGDSSVSDFFASAAVAPVPQMRFGVYWLSDLMETWGMREVGWAIAELPGYEKNGLAGAFANIYLGCITLNCEYVTATGTYNLDAGRYGPTAFNLEGSVHMHEKVTVGLKYEGSEDLYAAYDQALFRFGEKFPGQSYGAVVSYAFRETARVAMEFLHLEELDDQVRGNVVTVQLALTI